MGFLNKSQSLDFWRHTFATRGLEQGIPPKVMQTILGHSTLAMTMDLYSHVLPDTKMQAMKKYFDFTALEIERFLYIVSKLCQLEKS